MAVLKRQLGLLDVFSVATGAMISSGLFVLPAIAYTKAGPAVILAYLFASILVIPSILSKAELTTAMPKAGGTYFFVERSLGSIWGLFGGLAGWLSLALKGAFAIVGMAVLVEVVLASVFPMELSVWHLKAIAVVCCGVFTALNIVSVKHTSIFQIVLVAVLLVILGLVAILLVILGFFVLFGAGTVDAARYKGFLEKGWVAVFATAGMVFVSFGGLTKVASIGEEVKNPGRNLPFRQEPAVRNGAVVVCGYIGLSWRNHYYSRCCRRQRAGGELDAHIISCRQICGSRRVCAAEHCCYGCFCNNGKWRDTGCVACAYGNEQRPAAAADLLSC
jgi:amino acid transporter